MTSGLPLHLVVVEAQDGLGGGGGPAVQLVVVAARRQLPVVRRPLQPAHLPHIMAPLQSGIWWSSSCSTDTSQQPYV